MSLRFIVIWFIYAQDTQVVSFSQVTSPQTLNALLLSPCMPHTPPISRFFIFNTRIIFCDFCKSWRSTLWHFFQSSVTSSLLGPNTSLSTLSSDIFGLRSSLILRNQVSHLYQTCKIIFLYILIFIFLESRKGDKRFWTERWKLLN